MTEKIRVLYVDDEPTLLDIGKIYLERDGTFDVDTLTSAGEALTRLNTERYDAIVSDYQMPEMDGITFLKRLKDSGNTTPFIIFTGRGREEVVIDALNSGADFYLQKGGDPKSQFAELAHKIKTAVDRKRTEKLAKDTERRLYDIINFLPDATFAIDTVGTVIAWNRAMEEMTSAKSSEIVGKNNYEYALAFYNERRPMLIDLVLAPDKQFEKDKYLYTSHDSTILTAETTLEKPDGQHIHLWGKASLLFDENGNLTGAIESIRNISDRKNVDEQILLAKEEWERTFNAVPDLISIIDTEHTIRRVNRAMAAKLGVMPEQAVGLTCYQCVHGTQSPPDFCPHSRLLKDPQEHTAEIHEDRLGGHFLVTCTPLRDNDGKLIGSVHVARDITERKKAEEALRESEENYRLIMENSSDGIIFFNGDNRVQYVSPAYINQLGYSEAEELNRTSESIYSIIHADDRDAVFSNIYEAIAQKNSKLTYSYRVKHKKGHYIWREDNAKFLYENLGKYCGAYVVCRDITERKVAEEALRQNIDKLGRSERALRESEGRVRKKLESLLSPEGDIGTLGLADIIDVPAIQSMMDDYYTLTGISIGIVDIKGEVQVVAGMQDICAKFHRAVPESCKFCIESDISLTSGVLPGKFKESRCKNNMWDMVTPIMLADKHIGNLFLAQFLYDDEELDYDLFRLQARRFGYDETTYIAALERVPRFSREQVNTAMCFCSKLAQILSTLSHSNITLARTVTERDTTLTSLQRVNQKLNVLSQLTRKDLTSQIFVLNSYLELAKKQLAGQDLIIETVQKSVHAIQSIHETIEYSKDYQDMGAKPPKWQNVKMALLFGLSHISIGKIQHSLETENLEIFADPLLEKVCQRLFENSMKHGEHITHIRVWHTITPEGATIFFEDNGIGISAENKEQIFLRDVSTGRASMRSLIFVREILDITGITIRETGEPGKGARFEMMVPKGAYRVNPDTKDVCGGKP